MLSPWIKKAVLVAAISMMPLQGIAAVLTVLMCHGDSQVHATHQAEGHHHSDPAPDHHHDHGAAAGGDGSSGDISFHLCCNLAASVPPARNIDTRLPDFLVRAAVPAPLHDLFVPELPQRPPLA
jgi:ABC-type Zn2+ transport system substrate-binding protein/surface adhesin